MRRWWRYSLGLQKIFLAVIFLFTMRGSASASSLVFESIPLDGDPTGTLCLSYREDVQLSHPVILMMGSLEKGKLPPWSISLVDEGYMLAAFTMFYAPDPDPAKRPQWLYFDERFAHGYALGGKRAPADAGRVMDYLTSRKDVNPAKFGWLGSSSTGIPGLAVAAREPRLSAIVAFVSTGAYRDWLESWKTNGLWRGKTEKLWPETEALLASDDPIGNVKGLFPTAVLMVSGGRDKVVDPETARKFIEAAEPFYTSDPERLRLVVYENFGHNLPMDAVKYHAEQWFRTYMHPTNPPPAPQPEAATLKEAVNRTQINSADHSHIVGALSNGRSIKEARYLDEPPWVAPALAEIEKTLKNNPPAISASLARQEALMSLDGPLHLLKASRFRSTHEFLQRSFARAVAEIQQDTLTTGAKIWKLYNHGFVIRTPSVTLGFDIVPGYFNQQYYTVEDSYLSRLAGELDLLVMSHAHGDHSNATMRDHALSAGVTLLAEKSVFPEMEDREQVVRPQRVQVSSLLSKPEESLFTKLLLPGGETIEYAALPGRQAPETTNTVFVIRTGDGLTIMHTGDEAWTDDWKWIDRVSEYFDIDILLVNCWIDDLPRMVRGVKPKLVVTGHENEMSHLPDHREPYWQSFQRFRALPRQPHIIMGWGEAYLYGGGN